MKIEIIHIQIVVLTYNYYNWLDVVMKNFTPKSKSSERKNSFFNSQTIRS